MQITTLADAPSAAAVRGARMPLRLLLLARGLVSQEEWERAHQATERGSKVGDTLVELGYLSEVQLTAARAELAAVPFYTAEGQPIDAAWCLPYALTRQFNAVPMHFAPSPGKSGRLLLGFVDKVQHDLLRATELAFECKVDPCLIPRSQLLQQQERMRHKDMYQETIDASDTKPAMLETVVRHAWACQAKRIYLSRIADSFWVRLSGNRGGIDLLFNLESDRHNVRQPVDTNKPFLSRLSAALAIPLQVRREQR